MEVSYKVELHDGMFVFLCTLEEGTVGAVNGRQCHNAQYSLTEQSVEDTVHMTGMM